MEMNSQYVHEYTLEHISINTTHDGCVLYNGRLRALKRNASQPHSDCRSCTPYDAPSRDKN